MKKVHFKKVWKRKFKKYENTWAKEKNDKKNEKYEFKIINCKKKKKQKYAQM